MRIHSDFDALWRSVRAMGASDREFSFETGNRQALAIDVELERGIEINLEDLEKNGGLLSYQGRQVLLYIPDQGSWIDEVLTGTEQGRTRGKKYHVADCMTLGMMRDKGRFDRYMVTNDLSGVFEVSGTDFQQGYMEGEAELNVCKNCLKMLNYQGYEHGGRGRSSIFGEFTLEAFFKTYSTLFRNLPSRFTDRRGGYTEDWQQVSRDFRAGKQWTCESCNVNLADHRDLLHTHHVDGNKRNNGAGNLRALCADCHRKQDMHESMMVRGTDMNIIQRLRRDQGHLAASDSWDVALKLIDSAYEGLALKLRSEGHPVPEVGYDVTDGNKGVILTPELSWPDRKKAIVDNQTQVDKLAKVGWRAETVVQALAR